MIQNYDNKKIIMEWYVISKIILILSLKLNIYTVIDTGFSLEIIIFVIDKNIIEEKNHAQREINWRPVIIAKNIYIRKD